MALNLGAEVATLRMPKGSSGTVVLSTHPGREGEGVEWTVVLRGDEGVVVRMD